MVPYWISLSAIAGNANNEAESQLSAVTAVTVLDDIQRATSVLSKICTELFVKSKNEFMSELSNNCDVKELRYVHDTMCPMIRKQLGLLVDRKSGDNLKNKLNKDIYNLYLFGEGSITAFPNTCLSLTQSLSICVQTDSCLSGTLFATKSDLENLKAELLNKISYLKNIFF